MVSSAQILGEVTENSRPGRRRQALENAVRKLFRRKVAVLQQSTGFNLDVSNGTKLFRQMGGES
jgi:hypothetical protein